jgi:hypothetical protein
LLNRVTSSVLAFCEADDPYALKYSMQSQTIGCIPFIDVKSVIREKTAAGISMGRRVTNRTNEAAAKHFPAFSVGSPGANRNWSGRSMNSCKELQFQTFQREFGASNAETNWATES